MGEIGSYCRDRFNAVIISTEQQAADDVFDLLNDNARYQAMRNNAILTWKDKALYRECVIQACEALVQAKSNKAKVRAD